MNKIVKGSIAGAAGIALLLGGAGTFALWNDSTSISASQIQSGKLTLTSTAGSWFNTTTGTEVGIADITTFKIVPGNSVRWKGSLTVGAIGNSLVATLSSPTAASITNGIAGSTVTLTATSADATVVRIGATNDFTVTPGAGTTNATIPVVLDIVFPTSATGGMNGSIDLSDLDFTVVQTPISGNVNS